MVRVDELLSIGQVARHGGVATSTLRYYEEAGLLTPATRVAGRRRYHRASLTRLELIGVCKEAGFTLDEIRLLLADDAPGRPVTRALGEAKLAEIDARMTNLARARAIIERGLACTCSSIDTCSCGVHRAEAPGFSDASR